MNYKVRVGEEKQEKITFRDLSLLLKIPIVVVWFNIIVWSILIVVGIAFGLSGN